MKKPPEMIEGPEAFARFREATKAVLSVPHATIQRRIEEHRKHSDLKPRKRGTKSKPK